jgi:hypothetical protein
VTIPLKLAAVLGLAAILGVAPKATAATQPEPAAHCRVLGSGDSFLDEPALFFPDDWCIDVERGRDPYKYGHEQRASTYTILTADAPLVPRGGWLVIQDYNHKLSTPMDEWRQMLRHVVAALPNGRCVLGIGPYRSPAGHSRSDPAMWADGKARTQVMVEELSKQGCFQVISLNQIVHEHSDYVSDGTHLTTVGVNWLLGQMVDIMGS